MHAENIEMYERSDQPSPTVEGGCDEHGTPRDVKKQKSSKCMCGHTHAEWSTIPTYAEWLTRHPELTKNVASAQRPSSAENIAVSFCVSISVNMQHRLTQYLAFDCKLCAKFETYKMLLLEGGDVHR